MLLSQGVVSLLLLQPLDLPSYSLILSFLLHPYPQVFVQMYQDHARFQILLQCMSEKGQGAGRGAAAAPTHQQQQEDPALAAAAVSPAAAMLAMLRSPRLDAFWEADNLLVSCEGDVVVVCCLLLPFITERKTAEQFEVLLRL